METECFSEKDKTDPSLPLSSLRLLVPPLRLASAAMWQVAQRRDIMHYGKLEEFVTLVTDTVPELLTCRQRAQLIQSLRTRFILELCRGEHPADPQTIQTHVDRIQSPDALPNPVGVNDAEVEASEANFLELVQTLLKDPVEREHFFQEVFPVDYGPKYDATLQMLVWEFLSRLEHLLPVPDLTQTASLLTAAPSILEECVQCVSNQHQLKTLLQHRKCFGQLVPNAALPSMDDCTVSSLSLPPLAGVAIPSEQSDPGGYSESTHNCITTLSPASFSKEVVSECVIDSTDYAGVEVELRTSVGLSEGTEERAESIVLHTVTPGGAEEKCLGDEDGRGVDPEAGGSEPKDEEMENSRLGRSRANENVVQDEEDLGLGREREHERNEASGSDESGHTLQTGMVVKDVRLSRWKEKVLTHKMGDDLVIQLKRLPESQRKENLAEFRHFYQRKANTGWTTEASTQVFACSKNVFGQQSDKTIVTHPGRLSFT
ncbi:hypothetical protein AAFF_G00171340 [Aldrovandia affinis]|uniref:TERF1-interacting nuclear factor 2 N-terminal domain-containing protein n=1 Tax=Aldrovandia affinis TaxID=143900 RepID=A0AAD7SYM0_9TELE|nr:hypothetical protein AAFF_G00171340 [Aldrovandia affinis]